MRCPDIQRMTYRAGAEGSFPRLGVPNRWINLKVLDLEGVTIEPAQLVSATASLLALKELKLDSLPLLEDTLFTSDFAGLRLPPVQHLKLCNISSVTAQALQTYFQRPDTRESLSQLSLLETSIPLAEVHLLLDTLPRLQKLHISTTVSRPLAFGQPTLSSQSLRTLTFQVLDKDSLSNITQSPAQSYYVQLCSSITSGQFPSLEALYALSAEVPTLLMPPPSVPFAANGTHSATTRIRRELRAYTKTMVENDWELTIISPPSAQNRRGSRTYTRPLSLYDDPDINAASAHRPKDSVMVSNGWGGYLAVPGHERRPSSSKSKYDTDWMGV